MTEDNSLYPKKVTLDDFRDGIRSILRLCEEWLSGHLTNSEFTKIQQSTLDPKRTKVITDWGSDPARTKQLSSYFNRATEVIIAVSKAIEHLDQDGFGDRPAVTLRAIFFAKHAWNQEGLVTLAKVFPRFEGLE